MNNSFYTPLYNSLYKKNWTLGVSSKLFAVEIAMLGIIIFVLKIYPLAFILVLVHIIVAILNKKEAEWKKIFVFFSRIKDEKAAKLP